MDLDLIHSLAVPGTSKIVLLSADGLGGFPDPASGRSERGRCHGDVITHGGGTQPCASHWAPACRRGRRP